MHTLAAAALITVAFSPCARAQPVCDAVTLERLAGTITAGELRLPRPPRERGGECMSVGPPSLTLGPPVVGTFAGACPVVALVYQWTTMVSETCGNDVFFPPVEVRGVVVVRRLGAEWRRVAIGSPGEIAALDVLSVADLDGDGTQELVLAGQFALAIDRRRVILRPLD